MKRYVNQCTLGLMINASLYSLPVFFSVSLAVWAQTNDTIIVNGKEGAISDKTLNNSDIGINGFIIRAMKGASFSATNSFLNSSGIRGGGAIIQDSKFYGRDLNINVSGSHGTGIYLAGKSDAALDHINIHGKGTAVGLQMDGTQHRPFTLPTAKINDSTLSTENGDAIMVMSGDLALNHVSASTLGNDTHAINANMAATVAMEGGKLSTQGTQSDAVWIPSDDSSVSLSHVDVATQGNVSIGVNAQVGTAKVSTSTVETHGERSYGLYTENQLDGDNVAITTFGNNAVGLFTANGGKATLINSNISTQGELAAALVAYPQARIDANNVRIDTSGKQGFGLWSRAGTLNVNKSIITTSGEAAAGLYVNGKPSDASHPENHIRMNNVTLHAGQAQAIDVNATQLALEVKDSSLTGGNGQVMTVRHFADPQDKKNNIYSKVTFNAENSTLNGNMLSSSFNNAVRANLTGGSIFNGAADKVSSITLDSSSQWNMNNSSLVGQLTNNGTITFSDKKKFDTLNVAGDYLGDGGTLVMNGILAADDSPINKMIVGGDVQQGTTHVAINNLGGHGAQTVEGIEVVNVAGTSKGNFVKTGRIVAGAYDYDLDKKGQNWYLTSHPTGPGDGTDKPSVLRPEGGSYVANLAAANTLFVMSLHDRLGEPQFTDTLKDKNEVTSLWLRQVGGHNSWHDSSGQLRSQGNRYVAQIGGDLAQWSENGADRWHLGFMAGYGNQHSNTHNRQSHFHSKGTLDGYSVGGYATWYANAADQTGAYLDSWLQYAWFTNDVKGEKQATEHYKSHGVITSLEGGYTWKTGEFWGSHGSRNEWFIQPQAQLVWMGVRADTHHEDNRTVVKGEGDGNLLTRLGIKTYLKGHHALDNGKQREFQPFIVVNWLHNTRKFAAKMDGARVSQDGATNLLELKMGVEGQIDSRLNLWGNVGSQFGGHAYNDTGAMVGVKYNF
ncbi:membrane protein [bacteria symbiont BFo1 of Frankliniella occidentalis]|uniref:autotransporter outer membrane beta-barrel domain-containing protein n=2 Tax=Erwinia aphidicola TaxID=68334 RepID=UPI000789EC7B|nr:autotransporter outer membrane beta-barrel domain-containing protein [Erwinia aphidicola]KYP88271.1 membrane protein [bacteria symbiont BFo1 of Frankliniella occidentalis]CAH0160502.1 Outer membrane protein IcsA autotransporter [Erwinia aphidicola]